MKLGYLSKMVLFVKQMVLKMKLVVLIRENTQCSSHILFLCWDKLLLLNMLWLQPHLETVLLK